MNDIQTSFQYTIHMQDPIASFDALLAARNYSKLVLLGDSNSLEHCLPLLNLHSNYSSKADIIEIDPGEENKNIDICIGVWSMMQDFEMDRHSLLIIVGGGVVCDMGAFAASTYKRGIDFVLIPTSLLAMVDACYVGKTGLDLQHSKNQIGTFAQPTGIFILPEFLSTLPAEHFKAGMAEMLKHGLIADQLHLRDIICHVENGLPEMDELIGKSLKIKKLIVEQDPKEKGLRKVLNFGHSIGHAIESYYLREGKEILHGNAVATGMLVEAYLSQQHCGLKDEQYQYIISCILKVLEPARLRAEMVLGLLEEMKTDKKNMQGSIRFSLLKEIAEPVYDIALTEEQINDALIHCIHYFND